VSLLGDVLHLLLVLGALGLGIAAVTVLRARASPPRRYAVFAGASAVALFGCGAVGGEVGVLPPVAWFGVLAAALLAWTAGWLRARRPSPRSV
jgi:hypothetical protein